MVSGVRVLAMPSAWGLHRCDHLVNERNQLEAAPDMDFEFVDPGILRGDGFELFRFSTPAPDISRGTVPAYDFRIRIDSQIVGQVNLRVGVTEPIMLYAGNLGYKVDPPYRGRHLAARAINLLLPVARHHRLQGIIR